LGSNADAIKFSGPFFHGFRILISRKTKRAETKFLQEQRVTRKIFESPLSSQFPKKGGEIGMNWSSLPWPFKKGRDRSDFAKARDSSNDASTKKNEKEVEDEELGIIDSLLDFVKTFTIDTFKSYPLDQGTIFF
jgi:hypothetical protein